MKKVKITVLKTTLDEQLAREYGAEGLTACPMLKEGQVFYADYAKPEGFCDEAWKAIYQYVFALAHGATKEPFYCHMVPEKKYSIMETGSENRELPSAVAMTDYALSYSSSKRRTKSPR